MIDLELMFSCASGCGWREFASGPDEIVELTLDLSASCRHCKGNIDVDETAGVVVIDSEDVKLCDYCEERDSVRLVWYDDGKVLENCGFCFPASYGGPASNYIVAPLNVVLIESES